MAGHQCPHCGAESTAARPYCVRCGQRTASGERSQAKLGALSARLLAGPERQPLLAASTPLGSVAGGSAGMSAAGLSTPAPPAASAVTPAPKRRWFRRFAVISSLLLLFVIAVVGIYAVRVHQMFDKVHSVTTPAAEISGAALGGSGDLQIDTSPAKTALAGGAFPTETATAIPTATPTSVPSLAPTEPATLAIAPPSLPTATATAGSTGGSAASSKNGGSDTAAEATATSGGVQRSVNVVVTATATATVPPSPTAVPATATTTATATASVEPTVVLSQIERVTNGDFEAGNSDWYVEQGARVTTDDAHSGSGAMTIDQTGGYADQQLFFVAGTAYHVSGYARLSEKSKAAGAVGISFFDANGAQIPNTQPVPLAITTSKWTKFAFDFTPPAGATAVKIYIWKPSSAAVLRVDDLSVRSIVPATALDSSEPIHDDSSITILLMGVDARPGEAIDIGVRPDSLMVLHLDPETGSCRLLSIPRDTRTELPGYGLTKINHALAVGGIAYEQQVVEQFLKIKIDHYVLVDFNGFEDLVDAVGGITVDVPEAFTSDEGITFSPGEQTMNGQQALAYARWRGGADGDFGRQQRQQLILRALLRKGYGLNIVRSINELLPAVSDNLRTDLSPSEMAGMATDYRSRCTESSLTVLRLDGSAATYQDPLLQMPLYYIVVDEAEVKSKVASLMEP